MDIAEIIQGLFFFAIAIGFIVLTFWLLRTFVLWYWKVPDLIENQKRTNQLLNEISDKIVDRE